MINRLSFSLHPPFPRHQQDGRSWLGRVGLLSVAMVSMLLLPGRLLAAPVPEADSTDLAQPALPFADVPTDHWAYEAILNLYTNYGCLSGYPDGSFRGDQTVSRYEFAASLSECLDRLEILVAPTATQQEIDALIDMMEEGLQELGGLEERVGGED